MWKSISYTPIGVVRSPYSDEVGMPIQSVAAPGVSGQVEVFEEFAEGVQDLEGFSHLILLCHLHRIREGSLQVVPFLDTQPRGVFATRSPKRPNPIGFTIVRLERLEGRILHILEHDFWTELQYWTLSPMCPYLTYVIPSRSVGLGIGSSRLGRCVQMTASNKPL